MENRISVIISTYNKPDWLEKSLWGYHAQTFSNFELIIADDGSTVETKQMIEALSPYLNYKIKHVWHPDDGFQKTKITNKAILETSTDYILMSDGDCIPRADFIQTHIEQREKGKFLSGGYFMLPTDTSHAISKEDILNQKCFNLKWLKKNGLKNSFKNVKLSRNKVLLGLLNFLTPTKPTWNGHNASGWKQDILSVNGFDERMQYGGEDRELGERLANNGIKGKQIRYKAICIHLDHPRGYVKEEMWEINDAIRKETRAKRKVETAFGIKKVKK
ncbi:glycosyltransferase [Flavobacteriaceae bacterium Ap0902]|nr:glycosyltransferase [Flavobacteriaceae bacterium Ap0902]